jgi:putative addiction module component (TIGR02574 family)
MESAMGAKDVVKALLERLPDDCSLDDIIDRLYELERVSSHDDTALTPAQRAELERRLALLEREPGHLIPWADFRRELDRDE